MSTQQDGRLVDVESHDYGGNLCMPWFGIKRPGLDYYLSNLNLYMFVMSEITKYGTKHNMYIYDERASGKDGDSLCSIRFNYYMTRYIKDRDDQTIHKRAKFLFLIMDNCVGQNKSRAVLTLFSLLTVLGIYEGISLHYLEVGHSHGTPDVGTAHAKRALNQNYFVPEEIVNAMNTVQGINAQYIDFRNAAHPKKKLDYLFRTDWVHFFEKYFKPLPYLKESKLLLIVRWLYSFNVNVYFISTIIYSWRFHKMS
jgi:hypothetical protein